MKVPASGRTVICSSFLDSTVRSAAMTHCIFDRPHRNTKCLIFVAAERLNEVAMDRSKRSGKVSIKALGLEETCLGGNQKC